MNQIHDSFERSEYSDDIFAVLGRALTVATRFDASTKVLARLPLYRFSIVAKSLFEDEEDEQLIDKINSEYKYLNKAIKKLKPKGETKKIIKGAIEARNTFIHESTIGCINGFDHESDIAISNFMNHIEILVLKIIRGEVIISALISYGNKEPISDYPFTDTYEQKYVYWVMHRSVQKLDQTKTVI